MRFTLPRPEGREVVTRGRRPGRRRRRPARTCRARGRRCPRRSGRPAPRASGQPLDAGGEGGVASQQQAVAAEHQRPAGRDGDPCSVRRSGGVDTEEQVGARVARGSPRRRAEAPRAVGARRCSNGPPPPARPGAPVPAAPSPRCPGWCRPGPGPVLRAGHGGRRGPGRTRRRAAAPAPVTPRSRRARRGSQRRRPSRSPTTTASSPSGRSNTSYQSPPCWVSRREGRCAQRCAVRGARSPSSPAPGRRRGRPATGAMARSTTARRRAPAPGPGSGAQRRDQADEVVVLPSKTSIGLGVSIRWPGSGPAGSGATRPCVPRRR